MFTVMVYGVNHHAIEDDIEAAAIGKGNIASALPLRVVEGHQQVGKLRLVGGILL